MTKKLLSGADLDAQVALELPDRQTFCGDILVKITRTIQVIDDINLTVRDVDVDVAVLNVSDVNVAAALCGTVAAFFKCHVYQKQW